MTIDPQDILSSILTSLDRIDYIRPQEIPNIDLYMDQVTTFMEEHLQSSKRYPEDKILTKTMINNYAKNHLLPPPDRKKYSKEHILLFDLYLLLQGDSVHWRHRAPAGASTERFFHTDNSLSMQDIYEEVFSLEKNEVEYLKEEVIRKYKLASDLFPEAGEEDRQFLQIFSFICLLSFDVYVKKQVIEKLIDQLPLKNDTKKHHKE